MTVALGEALDALTRAVEIARPRLAPEQLAHADQMLSRVRTRMNLNLDTTIIAFAGGTGAGKSSLFNAVLGSEHARIGAIRPTTSEALAVSYREQVDILDYLEVRSRVVDERLESIFSNLKSRRSAEANLIALDLPDIDSDNAMNRALAAELIGRADALIWVLDPQKYADAVVHEQYLARMTSPETTTIVVLNHADEVAPDQLTSVLDHAQSLLAADGVNVPVLATSARTRAGVDILRARINDIIGKKASARDRMSAEVHDASRELLALTEPAALQQSKVGASGESRAAAAIAGSIGGHEVARAVGDSFLLRGKRATQWPLIRIVHSAKVDPLKRLHLDGVRRITSGGSDRERPVVTPATGLAKRSQTNSAGRTALGDVIDNQLAPLPYQWRASAKSEMDRRAGEFFADSDSILANTPVNYQPRSWWWTVVNAIQWLVLLVALVGGAWLALWKFGDAIGLLLPDPPAWGIFAVPTALLGGGLLLGWILSAITTALLRSGARRAENRVFEAISAQVHSELESKVLRHLHAEVTSYREFRSLLERASSVKF